MNRFLVLAVAIAGAIPLASRVFDTSNATHKGHGAAARETPKPRLGFSGIKSILITTVSNAGKHGVSLLAAGVAFYALFALFPALAAATWIFGLLSNPATIEQQLNNLRQVLPPEAWQIIEQQLKTLTAGSTSLSLAGIVSLIIALYSARNAASAMMRSLNVVYGVEDRRGFIKSNLVALLFTVVAVLILLVAIGGMVVAPILLNFVGLGSFGAAIISWGRWPALCAIMVLGLAMLYRYGADRKRAHWRWVTWGSASATAIWLAASLGFSWYVSTFNSYDRVYGSIGAVVVLLFWFWITAYSGILGAELDNAIERSRGIPPA